MEYNQIKKAEGLEKLHHLEILDLGGNQIQEIRGLDTLRNLKRLYLNENPIKELKGIEHLKRLELLDIVNCKIPFKPNWTCLPNLKIISSDFYSGNPRYE